MTWFSRNIGDPALALLTQGGKLIVNIFSALLHDTADALQKNSQEEQALILAIVQDCVRAMIPNNISWDQKLSTAVNSAKADLNSQGVNVGIHLLATLALAEVSKLRLTDPADTNPLAVPPPASPEVTTGQ